jgi:hypothetical protein
MKRVTLLTALFALVLCSVAAAVPPMFDVWGVSGGDDYLGTISSFEGNIDAASNYNYSSASGHPINGPTPAGYTAFVWMYFDNTAPADDRLSFNIIHDVDGGGSPDNQVSWEFFFTGTSYYEILGDDPGEGFTDNGGGSMSGDWHYWNNTDGGVIGVDDAYCGSDWEIYLAPESLGDIRSVWAANGVGDDVMMWIPGANYEAYKLTPHCPIPEPATLFLIGSGLLFGAGALRRKIR